MHSIADRSDPNNTLATIFSIGFRPFFLAAAIFSTLFMSIWLCIIVLQWQIPLAVPALTWHAHEMIFAYTVAIIAGFLLTAVRNWTGLPTVNGSKLALLFGCWLLARILPFMPFPQAITLTAILDLLFLVLLSIAITIPIVQAKAWRQLAILGKLFFIAVANICFYAGVFGWLENGTQLGTTAGLYLIIALILTMARRIMPFFTERGVGYQVTLINLPWLDYASLVLFLGFFVCELFVDAKLSAAIFALILFVLHSIRLFNWHTLGIWRKPLLWSLFVAYFFICAGFALYAANVLLSLNPFPGLHAFAYGGIGIITFSMMARVSLGHTGRDVHNPPRIVGYLLVLLSLGAVLRVFFPLIDPSNSILWLASSQILWIMSFAGFVLIYAPVLISPRIDGLSG